MDDQASIYDPVRACYEALRGEPDADTCCKRICILIRRMQRDGHASGHDDHFMTLANQLVAVTSSFGPYITEIYACIIEDDFETAIQIGNVMLQHEAMLHKIAFGKVFQHGMTMN